MAAPLVDSVSGGCPALAALINDLNGLKPDPGTPLYFTTLSLKTLHSLFDKLAGKSRAIPLYMQSEITDQVIVKLVNLIKDLNGKLLEYSDEINTLDHSIRHTDLPTTLIELEEEKRKHAVTEGKLEENRRIMDLLRQDFRELNSKFIDLPKETVSYASVTQTSSPSESLGDSGFTKKYALEIIPKDNNTGVEDIKMEIFDKVKLDNNKIHVMGVRKLGKSVKIELPTKTDLENLRVCLDEQGELMEKFKVNVPAGRSPRFTIKFVPSHVKADELMDAIRNNHPSLVEEGCELAHSFPVGENKFWILNVTPSAYRFLNSQGYIYMGWDKFPIEENFGVRKCSGCFGLGHSKSRCSWNTADRLCPRCSSTEKHNFKLCRTFRCRNCVESNKRYGNNFDVNHSPRDSRCPCYLRLTKIARQYIDY